MYKSTALYPLLGTEEGVRLPVSEAAGGEWGLLCPQREGGYTRTRILPDLPAFAQERLWILEGQLTSLADDNEADGNTDE